MSSLETHFAEARSVSFRALYADLTQKRTIRTMTVRLMLSGCANSTIEKFTQ